MKRILSSALLACLCCCLAPALAQEGSPLPGSNNAPPAGALPAGSAPTPGATYPGTSSPVPGALAPVPGPSTQQILSGGGSAAYRHLPLNHQNSAIRLEELRNIMLTARPKDFQDAITDYLNWLADMADAHWRIYLSFAKIDSLKAQADVEKQSTLKLGSLRRQALLLKAEFLIRNNRQPEALQPLVEIVVAEPRTATGEAAYSLLKQIGFSEEVPTVPSAHGPSGSIGNGCRPIAIVPGKAAL
jgi:hypothetical protein